MSYNLLIPVKLLTAQSMASSITSNPVEIKLQDNVGLQLDWTGAPVGTFSVQISITHTQDLNGNVTNAGTWVSLPLSPAITASGSADSAYIDLNQMSAAYVRLIYTRTSGTGALTVTVTGKAV